jgi:hypothetical protein
MTLFIPNLRDSTLAACGNTGDLCQGTALGVPRFAFALWRLTWDRASGAVFVKLIFSANSLESPRDQRAITGGSKAAELRGSFGHELVAFGDTGGLQHRTGERDSQANFADRQG